MAEKIRRAPQQNWKPTIIISTFIDGQAAGFKVWDNGPGISNENRAHIFTPFFTTKPTGAGNIGLGLAMSFDTVVQEHGGSFDVHSEPDQFTEFTVTLPRKLAEESN